MNIINDQKAQVSAELILLLAGIMVIVLIAMNIYRNYVIDMSNDIKDNEVDNLINKIDQLNDLLNS